MREQPIVTRVAWIEQSAVGLRAHLECGHTRVRVTVDRGKGVAPRGYGIGDTVVCTACPPDVVDEFAMFKDVREGLGTE